MLSKEMFTLDLPSMDQRKTIKKMEDPNIHCMFEDIEDHGRVISEESIIWEFSLLFKNRVQMTHVKEVMLIFSKLLAQLMEKFV